MKLIFYKLLENNKKKMIYKILIKILIKNFILYTK